MHQTFMPLSIGKDGKAFGVSGEPGDLLNSSYLKTNLRRKGSGKMKLRLAYILFFFYFFSEAQKNPPLFHDTLNDIYVFAQPILHTNCDSTYLYSDSLLVGETTVLRDLLFFYTPYQVREYGNGMIAGMSIRGAPASHTQVIWNDLPLNSPLNGQTDLNSLSAFLSDEIILYRGGMSMLYGDGAMAGALVIRNHPFFRKGYQLTGKILRGSYGKTQGMLKYTVGHPQYYFQIGGDYLNDKNTFVIPQKNYINIHGQRHQWNFLVQSGIHFRRHTWHLASFSSFTDRLLPGTLHSSSESRLIQAQQRYIMEAYSPVFLPLRYHWQWGIIHENYSYYNRPSSSPSSQGEALTIIPSFNLTYYPGAFFHTGLRIRGHYIQGHTDAYGIHHRLTASLRFFARYNRKRWQWDAAFGTVMSPYGTPFIGYGGIQYLISKHTSSFIHLSSNYRLPTFNDLYWQPGGNPSLLPEKNYEIEQGFTFHFNQWIGQIHLYYRQNFNLIRWTPVTSSYWRPENVDHTLAMGIELDGKWKKNWNRHTWIISTHYIMQTAKDQHTGLSLPYVPHYLWNNRFAWQWANLEASVLYHYQSFFFLDPTNKSWMPGFQLWHIRLKWKHPRYTLQGGINNIFNTYYELMPARPMPGRTFYMSIIWHIQSLKNKQL